MEDGLNFFFFYVEYIILIMDQKLLEVLACPKCKGDLELTGDSLICSKCRLRYRIEDGIPIMLIDEAEELKE